MTRDSIELGEERLRAVAHGGSATEDAHNEDGWAFIAFGCVLDTDVEGDAESMARTRAAVAMRGC